MKDKFEFLKRPWLILRDSFEILAGYDLDKCEHSPALAGAKLSEFEEKLEDAGDGIVVLDVDGPLMPSPSLLARFFLGAVDIHRVSSLIRSAQAAPGVKALILRINSPGGTVTGTPEAGDAVRAFVESGKPLFAFSRGTVASAAYWMAAPATEIVGTPSSRWGSIGAVRPHIDMSEAHRAQGMKVELFASGKHKGAGALGTSLTDEQRAAIKAEVDELGEQFRAHVEQYRDISRDDMEALVYYGDKALEKGFVDAIVTDFEELFERVSKTHGAGALMGLTGGTVDTVLSDNSGDSPEAPLAMNNENEQPTGDETPGQTPGASTGDASGDHAANLGEQSLPSLSTDLTKLEAKVDDRLASLEAKLDALIGANAVAPAAPAGDASLEEKTAREAARIAAESGTNPLTPDNANADGGEDFSQLSLNEKWSKYSEILASKGREEAHDFYVKNIGRKA